VFDAADEYDRHMGRYSRVLATQVVEAAGLVRGEKALDVGCGPGPLTGALAAVLGADHVAAVDPSPPFVAACRGRFPGARVELASAEALPFEAEAFDAVLSQLVVNFMTDALAGVVEMGRVTRPGGRIVAAVWDYSAGMTMLRRFWDAAAAVSPAGEEHDERKMRYATPIELTDLWSDAGLHEVAVRSLLVTTSFDDFADLWRGFELGVGPSGAYTVALDRQEREQLRDEYRRRLGVGDAPFELTARAWLVSGIRG